MEIIEELTNDLTLEPDHGKPDSFFGDRSVVMTKKQLKKVKSNPLIKDLYITDIGFYPYAKHHYQSRSSVLPENILIYCIKGIGTIQIGKDKFKLSPNTYFIIPAGVKHKYWTSTSDPWSIYWLHFGGDKSVKFSEYFKQVIPITVTTKSRINTRINYFNEILSALESGFSEENINYANLCLNALLASFFYVETFRSVSGMQSADPVDQSIFYMQRNINRNIKINDISEHVNLSSSHLSKLFRNKTGASPLDYFINLKMQEAARLLSNQSIRIKEVAFKLGYNDQYYFTRLFTKHFGTSPIAFSKSRKAR